jgi:PAS domain S-box-containing protein
MKNNDKTQEQRIKELAQLRQRVAELEASGRQRNRFEEALRAERDKAQQYLDIAEVVLLALNKKGEITLINRKGNHILGYKEGELLGKNWFTTCLPSHLRKKMKSGFLKLMAGKREITEFYENPALTKSGTESIIAWHNTLLKDAQGNNIGTLSSGEDITERKQAENELREFKAISDKAGYGITIVDLEGNVSYVNTSFARMHGYTPDEIIGKHLSIFHTEKQMATVNRLIERLNREGYYVAEEVWHKRNDNSEFPTLMTGTLIKAANGTPLYMAGTAIDITERKQAEEALRESETRFRTLFEAIPDTVLVHDDEGTILHINEIGAQQLEWSVKDLVGRNLREIVTPENRVSIADHNRETHTVGWSRFETIYVSRSGWKIMAEVNERPIKFGKEKAILSVARDITERKQAEKALVREKNFSNAVINSSPDLLFVFGEKGNIIQWNSNAENVTGYSASEISKMNVLDFVSKEDKKIAAEAAQEALTKGQASVEIDVLTKHGKKIPFFITGRRTKIENANCVVCTGIDITERKQAEEEVKRSYEQLRETLHATVNALASTVEMKDQYTAGHQPRVTQLACAIAEKMGLPAEQIEGIRMAASIHDLGKVIVPAEILNKPGPLTEIQYEMIKMHPRAGYDILKGIEFPWPVAQIILQHHELMDGSGYPQGLSGEEIMVEARILIVANVVEAMTSHRPYRPAFDIKEALAEISKNRGILYDAAVADACLQLFIEKGFTLDSVPR